MRDVIVKYIEQLETEQRSPNTIAAYRADLHQFADHVGDRVLTPEILTLYMSGLAGNMQIAPGTARRKVSALRSFFRWAVRRGFFKSSPVRKYHTPEVGQRLPRGLTKDQVQKLLKTASESDALTGAVVEVLYGSGLRASELAAVRLLDIDPRGYIQVHGKGNKARVVPLTKTAIDAVAKYFRTQRKAKALEEPAWVNQHGRPLNRVNLWALIRDTGIKAGLPPIHPHTLRHSFATHKLQDGADLRSIQILLGHSNMKTTEGYTAVDAAHARDVHAATHPLETGETDAANQQRDAGDVAGSVGDTPVIDFCITRDAESLPTGCPVANPPVGQQPPAA